METLTDLNTFTETLTNKGYDGYFLTQSGYPGKLEESISRYLKDSRKKEESLSESEFILSGYLKWKGNNQPSIECNMWVRFEKETFDLHKMKIVQKDRFGQLLKHIELKNLSVATVPKANMAIAMISDGIQHKAVQRSRCFKL